MLNVAKHLQSTARDGEGSVILWVYLSAIAHGNLVRGFCTSLPGEANNCTQLIQYKIEDRL